MKKLKFKAPINHSELFLKDVKRIVKIFADRGYEISEDNATRAWEEVSESWAAGWLILPESDEEIFKDCFYYFEELELI